MTKAISIKDKLPSHIDANREGLCWWWRVDRDGIEASWELLQWDFDPISYNRLAGYFLYTHWASFHSLPLPPGTGEEN